MAPLLQKWDWLQRSYCLAKDNPHGPVCFPPHPRRLEMRGGSWGAPCPTLAWPASTPGLPLSTEEELQLQSSFQVAQLQGWANRILISNPIHTRNYSIKPSMSFKRRNELQCVQHAFSWSSGYVINCTLRIDTCLLWLGFLKDHHNIYFLHVF